MKLSRLFGKGGSGGVENVSVSMSSFPLSVAGSGGVTVQKAGLPIEWETVLGGGSSAKADLVRPYAQSVWVRSAIGFVAQPITAVPLVFSRDRRGGDQVIDDPDLTAFWERPAVTRGGRMGRAAFIESTVAWLKLRGEAFWIMDDTWLNRQAKKSPLILARPQDMREILMHGTRELAGWSWSAANGRRETLIPEQVVHLKCFNPYDEVRGLAEWEAAKVASESDYQAAVFARNLMANNGDTGPFVIAKSGTPSDEQQKQIAAALRQKRELNRRGDFRAMFLTADVEVQQPGLQAVDAAYVAQRLENRHEIYAAFGVPMSFAEVMSSYSIGSASDRFRLIEDTCQPMGGMICDGIEQVEEMRSGKPLFAEFDWDEHSTMQAVRAERVESAVKLVDRGMPWQRANDYLRLKMPEFPGWDVGRIPFNLQEIEGAAPKKPKAEPEAEDPLEELEKLFRTPVAAPVQKGCGCGSGTCQGKAAGKVNPAWERVYKARRPWEAKVVSRIKRFLMDARAETLRKLGEQTAEETAGTKALKSVDVLSVIFDLGEWLPKWVKGLSDIDRAALMQAGAELWSDELGRDAKDDPLVLPSEQVMQAIAIRENRLRNAGQKVWDRVKADLQKAVEEGQSNQELAKAIKKSFAGIESDRAEKIAATEITNVYETGRQFTFEAAGIEWTQWLHSGLTENARPNHQAASGQIREMGEPFDIGGVKMLYPGDPAAPADEVIGCKCVRIAVAGPDGSDIEGNNNPDIPY